MTFKTDPTSPIRRFAGEYEFLSNFYYSPMIVSGNKYATLEHAYQAMKTTDPGWRVQIGFAAMPGKAKRLGREAPMRPGWDGMKVNVMRTLIKAKFADPELRALLLATGDRLLVEGNSHGDRYWGQVAGVGENWLGRLLMEERQRIREGADVK